jgi:tetratricopeptide (TPR) repeat protein
VFLLPCLLCYVKYATDQRSNQRKIGFYVASLLLLGVSLLGKAWGITIPAVMLFLDVYPLRRLGGKAGWLQPGPYLDKIPFGLLAVLAAMKAKAAQGSQIATLKTLEEWGIGDRIAQAFYGLFFYSYKTLVPLKLTPLVPIPENNNPWALRYVVAAILVLAVVALVVTLWKKWPAGAILFLCYLAMLSPILGIAQSGPQLVADRYSYVACLTWALLAGAGFLWLWRRRAKEQRFGDKALPAVGGFAAVLVATLGVLTWQQTKVWHDSWSLWRRAIAVDPSCVMAHTNLGVLERKAGNTDKAIEHYRTALTLKPDDPVLMNNLAYALRMQDDSNLDEAISLLEQAIEIQPKHPDIRYALASALMDKGEVDGAIKQLRRSIQLKEYVPKFHRKLGTAYRQKKAYGLAEKCYLRTLELEKKLHPNGKEILNALENLAEIALAQGRVEEAVQRYEELLEIDPDNGPGRRGLQRALQRQRQGK